MGLKRKDSTSERDAVRKLIQDINRIDDDKDKVGRYVLIVFAVVFTIAAGLLVVLLLNP